MTLMASSTAEGTVRDGLLRALEAAADFNSADVVEPVAVLWPDGDAVWAEAVQVLSRDSPILTLGDFDPALHHGSVPWLRMELVRERVESPERLPIVYLPGVTRKSLLDAAGLPEELKPIAGIVVRSAVFSQRNGSDWTPAAFLSNELQGLGLFLSNSRETREALNRCLPRLLHSRVRDLSGRTLDSADFDKLLVDDPVRQLLLWLGDPQGYQAQLENQGTWTGFVSLVKKQYNVNPVRDGALVAAAQLGEREGKWQEVWNRFAEVPQAFPGVADALRRGKPDGAMLLLHPDSWPQDNEEAEEVALKGVLALVGQPVDQIREELGRLRTEHEHRLSSVWAKLDQTSAATLVIRLADLADLTSSTSVGSGLQPLAEGYATSGWRTDEAFMATLMALEAGHPHFSDVEKVADSLYRPWLEATAANFQNAWVTAPPTDNSFGVSADESAGTCALFVDGLRFDVAAQLHAILSESGLSSDLSWGLAGVPTVTSTCKPAVSPVAGLLSGGSELSPVTPGGAAFHQEVLRKLMGENGWHFVAADSVGDPTGRGWCEGGDIDALGHNFGVKLARQIPDQVRQLSTRITELLNAGWERIVVLTDHGWLLLPGKLPKHHLPEHLTVVRKGRCARLSDAATVPPGLLLLPWRWDQEVQIALAPGVFAFEGGKAYEHGGLSPQESVVPRLVVTKPVARKPVSTRIDIKWVGLMLKVAFPDAPEGSSVDLRRRAADPTTSLVTTTKALKGDKATLHASDDHQGEAATVVVVGADGALLTSKPTQIPEA